MFRIVARLNRRARTMPRRSPFTSVTPGAFDRDVRAGAHGDADIGLRQRGRIVDAVAGHRDAFAPRLQRLDDRGFLIREHLGLDLIDADRFARPPRRSCDCRP